MRSKTSTETSPCSITNGASWQGQAADIFNKIPEDLKEIGRTTSWSKIKAAGKAILNKTASPKAKIQNHYKLNHKTQAAVSTGNSGLNNKLNANLFNWIEYAAKWNTNKTQC